MTTPVDPLGIKCWPSAMRPMSRPPMPLPKTFHESAYSTTYSPNYPNPSSWNTYDVRLPSQYHMPPPATSTSNDYLHFHSIDGSKLERASSSAYVDSFAGLADQKPAEESLDFASLDSDLNQFTSDIAQQDENAPIINLRKPSVTEHEPLSLDTSFSRRLSGSSFSMSSTAPTDLPELSAYSEVPSYASASASDYTPRSSLNLSATPLSPIPSPRYSQQDTTRYSQQETIRTESRSRASPSPRPSMRTAPYSLDSNRNKRWSTGSYAAASPARRTSPFVYTPEGYFPQVPNFLRHSSPVVPTPTSTPTNSLLPSANLSKTPLMGSNPPPRFHRSSVLLPSSMFDSNPPPAPLPSTHGAPHLFRTLQSNASPHDHHLTHYTEDLSDPPDLFGPLSSPPSSPPGSDMSPPSPSLAAHEQDLRFPTDLYTPKYVRGHGNKREGWCGICKPGRWLVLKNSAFWYDKSFTHGVSAATGQAFESPRETRRMEGNSDVWEGLCGSCGEWVALVSSKKKGTTWFRHAYKVYFLFLSFFRPIRCMDVVNEGPISPNLC
jgi:hypothetical protein